MFNNLFILNIILYLFVKLWIIYYNNTNIFIIFIILKYINFVIILIKN